MSGVKTVAVSNVIGGSQNFKTYKDMEIRSQQRPNPKMKSPRKWFIDALRGGTLVRTWQVHNLEAKRSKKKASSEVENDAVFSDNFFSDDDSFFDSDVENLFDCTMCCF